jgi:uncharacterized protein (DUF302 family)
MASDGPITLASSYAPKETIDRLEREVMARGMSVFARIDHAAGAAEVGLPLRPTEVLIFGNAKGGTPLMQMNQGRWHRLAVEGLGLAGRGWQGLAVLQ